MKITETILPGVCIIEPKVFADERGFFFETWQEETYKNFGIKGPFVQDNLSFSTKNVLRGLHYQEPNAQGKLVSVISGQAYDVAVDIRLGSPTFGRWFGITLSASNHRQLWIPTGFAHGFVATSPFTHFLYKCTDFYNPQTEGGIIWNDPDIGIDWPITEVVLSEKDKVYPRLRDIPTDRLPNFKER